MWSSSFSGSVKNITWSNRLFVTPGNYSIGNGTNATSYEIDRVIPVDVYTKFGFCLSLNGLLWSFGDVVWKNTEIWVTGARNHDWCNK